MLRNYLIIAWRNLIRYKVFSLINILGLAIGMAACLLIFLYVQDELNYDQFHEKADRIYRVTIRLKTAGSDDGIATAGIDVGPALKRDYPEIVEAVRFKSVSATVKKGSQLFNEKDIYRVDKQVFEVFSYAMLMGNPATALAKPNSVVLTERLAKKYFGEENAVGKSLQLDEQPYLVTGILKDLPSNTDLKFTALLSLNTTRSEEEDWLDPSYYTFLLFKSKHQAESFPGKLIQFNKQHYLPRIQALGINFRIEHRIQPLTQVHFSEGLHDDTPKGNRAYLTIFSLTALFILLVACINYVNLFMAQSTRRQKEVGVRKVVGASKKQLLTQFIGESTLLILVSVGLALTLAQLISPAFNRFTEKAFTLLTVPGWNIIIGGIGLVVFLALVTGSYPAWYLSSVEPVSVLKGKRALSGRQLLRELLVVLQFTISVTLIVGTLVVYWQMNYLRTKNLGFSKEQILVVDIPSDESVRQKIPVLKNQLLQNSRVRKVSIGPKPAGFYGKTSFIKEVNDQKTDQFVNFNMIDEDYLGLLQINVVAGRNFSTAIPTDRTNAVIVNEAFVKWMGWKEVVGRKFSNDPKLTQRVIGVVRDFHYTSLHNQIEPLLLYYNTDNPVNLLVSIRPADLEVVRSAWETLIPNRPFEYSFLDAAFDQQYQREEKMMILFTWFSALIILIACLGLFGLASFTTIQRTKEIGVRKVLGATVSNILFLLSKDFIKLVLIANLLACPLAYWGMHKWLENYAFRISISPWLFVLSAFLVLLIALLTVSFQTWKAARQNPVKALRYE